MRRVFRSSDVCRLNGRKVEVMTREEAIEIIEDLIADVIRTTAEENKALDLAISALQAELSVSIQPKAIANNCDLISRADAIEAVRKELVCDGRHETHDKTCRFIADVLLSALPSADRPSGEWISYKVVDNCYGGTDWICSECGHVSKYQEAYCMACGARMENKK